MGSFLFANEQTQDQPPKVEPTRAAYEAALDDLAQHRSTTVAGGKLADFDKAETLYRVSRELEPKLIDAIAGGKLTRESDAVAFVRGIAPGWYPAEKMVALMILHAGGTYAALVGKAPKQSPVTAAQTEAA
jgi:hypothetical protein